MEGFVMTQKIFDPRNFLVTSSAVAQLRALRDEYKKPLRFRVYIDAEHKFNLRVHDTEYRGDWTIEASGIGISFCKRALAYEKPLVLHCRDASGNNCGFEFILQSGQDIVALLDGDDAIERIMSSEVEVCDTYGEYCYSTYS
jgi:hypothetical protein